MNGTYPAPGPSFVEKPASGRIGIIFGDDGQSPAADPAQNSPQSAQLLPVDAAGWDAWMSLRPPQDFIRHPVADTGKTILEQQGALDRQPPVSV